MLDIQRISLEKPDITQSTQAQTIRRCSAETKSTPAPRPGTLAEDFLVDDEDFAEYTDEKTGNVTTYKKYDDGSVTITVKDPQGRILSKDEETYKRGLYAGRAISQYTYNEDGLYTKETRNYDKNEVYLGKTVSGYTYNKEEDLCLEKQLKYDANDEYVSMDYVMTGKNGCYYFSTLNIKNSIGLNDPDGVCILFNEISDYQLSLVLECYPNLEQMVDKKFYDGWNIFGWQTGIQRDDRQDAIIKRIKEIAASLEE